MNYGQRGRDLLLDLKRSDWLPSYDEDAVRATIQESALHHDKIKAVLCATNRASDRGTEDGPAIGVRPKMLLHDASVKRNKRCLLAYHAYRMDKLRSLRWETSGTLPPSMKHVLSEAEVDFFHEYDKLASKYTLSGSMGSLDWNADLNPPQENFVQVRVVRPGLGKIETEMCGVVELEVGTMHYLPRGDVEHLVRQGALVQLSGEESF